MACREGAIENDPTMQTPSVPCKIYCANNRSSRMNQIVYSAQPDSASQATSDGDSLNCACAEKAIYCLELQHSQSITCCCKDSLSSATLLKAQMHVCFNLEGPGQNIHLGQGKKARPTACLCCRSMQSSPWSMPCSDVHQRHAVQSYLPQKTNV